MTGYMIESRPEWDSVWHHGRTVYANREDAERLCQRMHDMTDGWEQRVIELYIVESALGSPVSVSARETLCDTENVYSVADAS